MSDFGGIHEKPGVEILGSINNQVNLLYMVGQLSTYGAAGDAAKTHTKALLDRLTALQDEMAQLAEDFDNSKGLREVWRAATAHDNGMYSESIVMNILHRYNEN